LRSWTGHVLDLHELGKIVGAAQPAC
jgi:hypothetical protein